MSGSCATGACQIVSAFSYSAQGLGDELSRALASLHGAAPIFFPLLGALIGACVAHAIGRSVERWPKMNGWKAEDGGALLQPPPYLRMARASGGIVVPIISWLPYSGAGAVSRWAYPAIEMTFALAWAAAIAWTGPAFSTWILLSAFSLAFFCAWLDLVCHEIPDCLTVPLAFLGLLFSPIEPDAIFRKRRHSALIGSGLDVWLVRNGIRRILVSGIRTEQCCETTTRHASDLGYMVDFVSEATLTFPMTDASGRQWSAAEIRDRSELVLADRFARIATVEQALAGGTGRKAA